MKVAVLVLLGLLLAGCGDKTPEPAPIATPEPTPTIPTPDNSTIRVVCVDAAVMPVEPNPDGSCPPVQAETTWRQPCDWSASMPSKAHGTWMERRPLNIAHQGGENEVPSATMYALKTALRKGADMLELDVSSTADDQIIVMHDTTIDRTTDGTGAIEDLTLEEIQSKDAAYWFVPGKNAIHDAKPEEYVLRGVRTGEKAPPPGCTADDFRVPTLREVLETFPDVMINIEIKNGAPQGKAFGEDLAALLAEFERGDDTVVVAFVDTWTYEFKLYNQDVSTAGGTVEAGLFRVASEAVLPGLPAIGHQLFQVPIEFNGIPVLDEDFVKDAHANGFAVHAWTIDDPDEMRRLLDWGVDGIMTAEPTVLEQVLQERETLWS